MADIYIGSNGQPCLPWPYAKRPVNPAHLYAGSFSDNMLDKARRGYKTPGGEGAPASRLKTPQVVAIRCKYAEGAAVAGLAEEFGISQTTVRNICRGRTWVATPGPTLRPLLEAAAALAKETI